MGSRSGEIALRVRKYWFLYVLILPPLLILLIYQYYPMLLQVVISFKDYRLAAGVWGSPWAGMENFRALVTDLRFPRLLFNTVYISFLRLFWGFWPPILLSIMLFDLKSRRFRQVCQTIVYIPHFFSWVIVYSMAFAIFSTYGFANVVLSRLGGSPIQFFLNSRFFRPILISTAIWKEIGWGTIIYLAALTTVDTNLYDAAKIDGCGPVRRIFSITLPSIMHVVVFLLTLSIGNILRGAGTEQILLFYNPAVYDVADIIDTWVYRQGLTKLQYSMATSLQFFQSFFGLILIVLANKASRRWAGVGIW